MPGVVQPESHREAWVAPGSRYRYVRSGAEMARVLIVDDGAVSVQTLGISYAAVRELLEH
jgi:hypothetical protein